MVNAAATASETSARATGVATERDALNGNENGTTKAGREKR
jgi:hypothetical protein